MASDERFDLIWTACACACETVDSIFFAAEAVGESGGYIRIGLAWLRLKLRLRLRLISSLKDFLFFWPPKSHIESWNDLLLF